MRDELVALTSALVAIDSVNPALVEGGAGEGEAAAFVARWARDAGLDVAVLEATPGRPSVVVRARGTGGGRTLVLCGHLDTVGVAGMVAPFTACVNGDRLAGRGAYDMKGGVAAALLACRALAAEGLAGDVVVAAVADEEHASAGVREVLERAAVRADAAIVVEPTELAVAVAHKGFVWSEIEVLGRAAHGSRPHLGVDAIVKAGPVLAALGELDAALAGRTHPLLGRGSVHASTIAGGEELSSYPARCVIGVERRTLPGESAASVEAELDGLLGRCRAADPELSAGRRTLMVREPFAIDPGAELVGVVAEAAGGAQIGGVSYWADSAFLAAAGIPTVVFGPAGAGAHATEEWVSIDALEATAAALVGAGRRICA
jgi:acetylornithine deacetylase